MTSSKAIIIGEGSGGLAALIGLRRSGIDAEVYERASEPHELGAGLTLWAKRDAGPRGDQGGDILGAISVPAITGGIPTTDGMLLAAVSNYAGSGTHL